MNILKTLITYTGICIIAPQLWSAPANVVIDSIVSDTVGTTAVISGSGTKDNTTTFALGEVGRFGILVDGVQRYMSVNMNSVSGSLTVGEDSLMVTQTVNSQGLTDSGTLSIYISPDSKSAWTANMSFSFYEDEALTTPFTPGILLTSLDIDYDQVYSVKNDDIDDSILYGATQLTSHKDLPPGYTGFIGEGNAEFYDPEFAVSTLSTSQEINFALAHDDVALFMFEFRNPPAVIPEVGTLAMMGIVILSAGSLALLRRRKR
ncbi:hypothetical protein P3T73_03780 [Kiritimatiellota bacterium B12222]|nr:hypothetical protein P3T73_03780 [Kiritimatiellota bacterium B12222]